MEAVLEKLGIKIGDKIFVALIGQGGVVAKAGPGGQPSGPGQLFLPRRRGTFHGLTTFTVANGNDVTWLHMRVDSDPGGPAEAAIRVEAILEVGYESNLQAVE